ncbi:MAG: tRNA guanosine(15) transglycosylase TgtA [Archaeoglobaceae archaeon]
MHHFEIFDKDVMGRIAKFSTPHGVVETPALMPVINPNIKYIPPREMKKYGAQILITNSYIIYRSPSLYRTATEKGLHRLLNVDMPVMTDSGSYQLMTYGDVEVDNAEIVEFQRDIGSDIVVPLDIPTPPDVGYSKAEDDLETTLHREKEAVNIIKDASNLIALPVQGSTYSQLRMRSAREVNLLQGDVVPIGAIVPLLDEYRFAEVIKIVLDVKSVLSSSTPVHLFGAGHPLFFSISAALGCDLFDSAAYALYAKDDRFLTPHGTKKLQDLHYLPCNCPICSAHTPDDLQKMSKDYREVLIGEHNLWVSFEEMRKIKQAIKEKTLFEFVERRIRGHPNLVAAWRQIKDYLPLMEEYDPSTKQLFFYTGIESGYRPAVARHQERVKNIELEKEEYLISTDMSKQADIYLKPVFGVIFAEMLEVYPAGHAEMPSADYIECEALEIAVKGLKEFLSHHKDKKFRIIASSVWKDLLNELPSNTVVVQ